jgi:hypothetical protein
MAAKYILTALSLVFLVLAIARLLRDGGRTAPASRTWLLIALIFGAVSFWLWTGGHQ